VVAFLIALLPSAGVLLLFWIVMRALLEADRRERAAQARFEAQRQDNHSPSPTVRISTAQTPATGGEESSSAPMPPSA
jgi:hypothetical protein